MVLSNILFRQSEPFSSNLFSSRRSRPLGSRLMNISASTCNKDAPAAKLYPYCGIAAPDIGGSMHADKRHCQAGAWRYHPVPLPTSVTRRQVTRRLFIAVSSSSCIKRARLAAKMPSQKQPLCLVGLRVHPLNSRTRLFSNPCATDIHHQYIVHKRLTAQKARHLSLQRSDRFSRMQPDQRDGVHDPIAA